MSVEGVDESRILANYDGSFDQVSTLAHELGHAYHNHCQSGLALAAAGHPMTLAETASIFCETLIAEEALEECRDQPAEQLAILEAQLGGATQVCLDIRSRFHFESGRVRAPHGKRTERRRILPADARRPGGDLCRRDRSRDVSSLYVAVEAALLRPRPNFYNFPYAFGHLFSLGLYAIYRQTGPAFVPRYDALLRATNQDYAAPLPPVSAWISPRSISGGKVCR